VRDTLDDALAFWSAVQGAGVLLDNRSEPTHLETWRRVAT
jgi:hypothetical protein